MSTDAQCAQPLPATLRQEIVSEAREWIRTPYIKRGRIKGVGVDCGMLPYMIYRKFALTPEMGIGPTLEDDWFCHATSQRYALIVERYFICIAKTHARRELPEAQPGDLVLLRGFGSRVFNHAGIVTNWPHVIHATPDCGVAEVDASTDPSWALQEIAIYDIGI